LGGSTSIEFEKFMLRMTLNITNLTDENYISHLSRLKPDGIANMGRSFNLGIKVEI
jgi:iron complex outermembrane receptor protein